MVLKTLLLMMSTVLSGDLALAIVTSEEQKLLNAQFAELLKGKALTFKEVNKGMTVPLNSVVTTQLSKQSKDPQTETLVTIAFRRHEVDPLFLRSLLGEHDVERGFPFVQRGIEAVLTHERLKFTIHEGATFHLRNDLPEPPGIKIFASEDIVGVVTEVRGRAFVSTDREIIKDTFSNVWTGYQARAPATPCILGQNCFVEPDGTIRTHFRIDLEGLKDLPRFYPPRVEE